MIVDDVANLIRYNIVDKLKATPVETEYDTCLLYTSPSPRDS